MFVVRLTAKAPVVKEDDCPEQEGWFFNETELKYVQYFEDATLFETYDEAADRLVIGINNAYVEIVEVDTLEETEKMDETKVKLDAIRGLLNMPSGTEQEYFSLEDAPKDGTPFLAWYSVNNVWYVLRWGSFIDSDGEEIGPVWCRVDTNNEYFNNSRRVLEQIKCCTHLPEPKY